MLNIMRFSLESYQGYFDHENSMVMSELNKLSTVGIIPDAIGYEKTGIGKITTANM
jgi:hypothetical protein